VKPTTTRLTRGPNHRSTSGERTLSECDNPRDTCSPAHTSRCEQRLVPLDSGLDVHDDLERRHRHASAIYNTGRQAAIAVCVAILSAVVASVAGPPLVAFHAAYLAAAAIAALAALTLIRTSDAAPSMVSR
jgi:hypothetical protein